MLGFFSYFACLCFVRCLVRLKPGPVWNYIHSDVFPWWKKQISLVATHRQVSSASNTLARTHGEERQLVVGAMWVNAVQVSSSHIHSSDDQRRTHVTLVPEKTDRHLYNTYAYNHLDWAWCVYRFCLTWTASVSVAGLPWQLGGAAQCWACEVPRWTPWSVWWSLHLQPRRPHSSYQTHQAEFNWLNCFIKYFLTSLPLPCCQVNICTCVCVCVCVLLHVIFFLLQTAFRDQLCVRAVTVTIPGECNHD